VGNTAFKIVALPIDALRLGHNVLAISTGFTESTDLEAVYAQGHFNVRLDGARAVMPCLPQTLVAGDVTAQGLSFYTGRICYRTITSTSLAEGESAHVVIPDFGGACARVGGKTSSQWETIAWPRHEADVTAVISSGVRCQYRPYAMSNRSRSRLSCSVRSTPRWRCPTSRGITDATSCYRCKNRSNF
jgi:hypothetical protein